jgi:hypothetical protein
MKQAITLITLILFFNLYAQTPFYHAKISLTNGETKEGYAELPQNTTFSKSVYYKESKDAKKATIKRRCYCYYYLLYRPRERICF